MIKENSFSDEFIKELKRIGCYIQYRTYDDVLGYFTTGICFKKGKEEFSTISPFFGYPGKYKWILLMDAERKLANEFDTEKELLNYIKKKLRKLERENNEC